MLHPRDAHAADCKFQASSENGTFAQRGNAPAGSFTPLAAANLASSPH
jgi:hypothetical protein